MSFDDIKTAEDARQYAIDWQLDFENHSYSSLDLIDWQNTFNYLAEKYDLLDEFIENGIL